MVRIEYVYEKPIEKKPYKKIVTVLAILILIAVAVGFIYSYFNLNHIEFNENNTNQKNNTEEQNITEPQVSEYYENITIPPEYKGPEGLEYVRINYAPNMDKAKSLCTEQFGGEWIDTTTEMGCYNMQGFLTLYCGVETIQNLTTLCKSINGNSTCSSNRVSCTV